MGYTDVGGGQISPVQRQNPVLFGKQMTAVSAILIFSKIKLQDLTKTLQNVGDKAKFTVFSSILNRNYAHEWIFHSLFVLHWLQAVN